MEPMKFNQGGSAVNQKRSLMIVLIAIATFLSGCAIAPLAPPKSPESSMAIIQPIVSGKMRVGLSFNTYSYYKDPSHVSFMNNQNRVICPDVKNEKTGDVFQVSPVLTRSLTPQCYYPNLTAGTYTFNDYKFDRPGEMYKVVFVTLSKSLLFRHDELKFKIGSGEVKYLGKFVIYFEQSGDDLVIDHIVKLDARESIKQAKLDLERDKSPWKLK
jgi:hypothetical protein